MVRKNLLKSLSVVMACMMAVMTVACGKNTVVEDAYAATNEVVETKEEQSLEEALLASGYTGSGETAGKVETVYVTANASGAVNDVIVSEWLKNVSADTELSDKTELKDIVNVKGNESFTQNSDGTLTWNADGSDIYYQGTTDKELPVDMKITYTLDGKEISPEELAGKSGKVTIRFEYDNKAKQTVNVDGKDIEVYTPFAMVSGMMLDAGKFANVEVSNGKVISDGGNYIVMGVALPGLKESLDISDEKWEELEGDEDLDSKLSNYFEISAFTSDFELGMTITMASSDILSDFGLTDITGSDKISDLKDDMNKLSDGSTKLVDGSQELKDGTTKLRDGSQELYDGTGKLYDGTKELYDGTTKLYDGTNQLSSGANELYNGTSQLSSGANELHSGTSQLSSGANELYNGTSQLSSGANELHTGTSKLSSGTQTLAAGAGKLSQGTKSLYDGVVSYTDGAAKVDQGAGQLAEGSKALKDGSAKLSTGLSDAKTGSEKLAAGAGQLYTGVQKLGAMTGAVEELLSTKSNLEYAKGYLTTPGTSCPEALVPLLNQMSNGKITSAEQADVIKNAGLEALASQNSVAVSSDVANAELETGAEGGELTNPSHDGQDAGAGENGGNTDAVVNGESVGNVGSGNVENVGTGVVGNSENGTGSENAGLGEGENAGNGENSGAGKIDGNGENLGASDNGGNSSYNLPEGAVVFESQEAYEAAIAQAVQEALANEVAARVAQELPEAVKKALQSEEAQKLLLESPELLESILGSEELMEKVMSNPELLKDILESEDLISKILSSPEIMSKIMESEEMLSKIVDSEEVIEKLLAVPEVQDKLFSSPAVQAAIKEKMAPIVAEKVSLVSTYTAVLGAVGGSLGAVDKVLSGLGIAVTADEAAAGVTIQQKAEAFSTQINMLVQGVGSLKNGADALDAGLLQLSQGATALDSGVSQLSTGASTLAAGTGALVANNDKLTNGAKELNDGAGQLYSGVNELKSGAEQLDAGAAKLAGGAGQVNEGAGKLASGAGQVNEGAGKLANGAGQVNEGAGKLSSGAGELNNGARDLNSGADKLNNGAKDLKDGAGKLTDGIVQLDDGVVELLDGVRKLDKEGIKKLYEAFDGDLTDFANKLTAIQEAGASYTSFAGTNDNENSNVKFIIKTAGVKAQDI